MSGKIKKSASYSNASISGKDRIEGLWKKRNGYVYYKNDKGIKQMGDKTYFFDQNGRQKTGWIKIGRYYYFFRIANGSTGYMLKSCRINGMRIDRKGRAHGDQAKLKVLSLASNYVHRYTKPLLSRDKRYQLCYKKVINTFHYGGSHTFKGGNWSVYYADRMLKRHKEVCWGFAGALAYMANACGYQNVKVQATKKHGWANVNGKIVDGSYGASHKSLKWFMFDASAKGRIFPATVYKHPEFSVKV